MPAGAGGSGVIGRVDLSSGNERMYYVKDHPPQRRRASLGSTRVTISTVETGNNVAYASDYYPFGESIREYQVGTKGGKYKFTRRGGFTEKEPATKTAGKRDAESSYDYFGARYYNNKLGVWLSADPLAEKYPGFNPFNYCINNPLRLVDPTGMSFEDGWTTTYKANWNGNEYDNTNGDGPDGDKKKAQDYSISDKGVEFIAKFEKYRKYLYDNDGAKNTTIGYGHLVHKGAITKEDLTIYKEGWTKTQALKQFRDDLSIAEGDVKQIFGKLMVTQNQYDALVSLSFNTGGPNLAASSLTKLILSEKATLTEIGELWQKSFTRSGGQVVTGLINRRIMESKMYTEGENEKK